MPKSEKYGFFNIPEECSARDYEESANKIIGMYSKTSGLLSIYTWGSVTNPGISDLDIAFVFKENPGKPLPLLRRSFYSMDAKTRYLARHPFVFIGEDSFRNVRYIYQNADFRLLHGRDIKIKELSSHDLHNSSIALLNDLIIRHYPRDFLGQLVNKNINARDTLLRLNSLKYSLSLLEKLTKAENKWHNELKMIENLRSSWFKNNDFASLVLLNKSAVDICMDIISTFDAFLQDSNFVKIINGSFVEYNGVKNKSLFVKGWSKENSLSEMFKFIKKGQNFSILPISISAQLVEYSRHEGRISSYIKANIKNGLRYKLKHEKAVKQRIGIFNKQAELAYRLKHSDFAAYFDFGYRNTAGINNWALRLIDGIRF